MTHAQLRQAAGRRPLPTGRPLATLGVALAALAIFVAGSPAPAAATAAHHTAKKKTPSKLELSFGASLLRAPSVEVKMDPAGISLEYSVMAADMGSSGCPPPSLAAELARLGSPPLQLGGVSQDQTAPPGALTPPAPSWQAATLYQLPAGFWNQLHCLLSSTREPLTVGLNMRTGSLAWATQMASEARTAAVDGLAFSLGNEPDLYELPNYSALDKPIGGEEAAYATLYEQLAQYLRPALGSEPVVGPELAVPSRWRQQLPLVVRALGLGTIGVHMYPLTTCRSPTEATIKGLLSRRAGNAPARISWVALAAHALGLPAIISEANSASCGGQPGVSNSPASAVWGLRFGLSALEQGFDEVRFHFSGNSYDPFAVRGSQIYERPLANTLVALNTWLPVGTALHPVPSPKLAAHGLIAHAALRPDGSVLLIIDNESSHAAQVLLRGLSVGQLTLMSPVASGLPTRNVASPSADIRVAIPANAVAAISGRL